MVAVAAPEDTVEALGRLTAVDADIRQLAGELPGVEFVLARSWDLPLGEAPDLRVLQMMSSGTDALARQQLHAGVTVCNAHGIRDAAVAEWIVGALLGATTGLLGCAREHHRRDWRHFRTPELSAMTVLIVGFGRIGRAVGERLAPFGTEVIAVARSSRHGVHAVEELPALVPCADAVVLLTPLTPASRGLVDAALLDRMRDGTVLINAARGAVVDAEALVAELRSGRLVAVLDVTDPEPLPAEHPLWDAPGLLALTPHLAGDTTAAHERALRFAAAQITRYARGEPLLNVVS